MKKWSWLKTLKEIKKLETFNPMQNTKLKVMYLSQCRWRTNRNVRNLNEYTTFYVSAVCPIASEYILTAEVRRQLSKLSREAYASVCQVFVVKISDQNCFELQFLMLL